MYSFIAGVVPPSVMLKPSDARRNFPVREREVARVRWKEARELGSWVRGVCEGGRTGSLAK